MNYLPSSSEDKAYYYKMVAKVGDRYFSIFNATFEYKIGKALYQEAQPDHQGGFYVYGSMEEALMADIPKSKGGLYHAPRVILTCICWGTKQEYDNGKLAFSYLCPIAVSPLPKGYLVTKDAKRSIEEVTLKTKTEKPKFSEFIKHSKFITRPKTADKYKSNAVTPLAGILKEENEQLEDSILRMEQNLRKLREMKGL